MKTGTATMSEHPALFPPEQSHNWAPTTGNATGERRRSTINRKQRSSQPTFFLGSGSHAIGGWSEAFVSVNPIRLAKRGRERYSGALAAVAAEILVYDASGENVMETLRWTEGLIQASCGKRLSYNWLRYVKTLFDKRLLEKTSALRLLLACGSLSTLSQGCQPRGAQCEPAKRILLNCCLIGRLLVT